MCQNLAEYFEDKNILILGFGKEGRSTYDYIRKYHPDKKLAIADRQGIDLPDENVTLMCGDGYMDAISDYELVMKSPGISVRDVLIKDNVSISCQTDLFLRFAPCEKIGITGTKGKTTTSTLIHAVLRSAGFDTCLIGNIGVPVFDLIDGSVGMTAVIEMSSHQLEFTRSSPHIAVLTNIYPEHLDHYNGFAGYVKAKANIVKYQGAQDFFIYNKDQDIGDFIDTSEIKAKQIAVGTDEGRYDAFLRELSLLNPHLKGRHNAQDVFYTVAVARCLNIADEKIRQGIESFKGIPHRMEFVGTFGGISFYNDSIATIPTSVLFAVEAIGNVDTIIIGGMDRGLDYTDFVTALAQSTIENIVCLPETGHSIGKVLQSKCGKNIVLAEDMAAAVKAAYDCTRPGSSCLFSPAASSYNYYKNFEEKGNHFKSLVKSYPEK